MKALHPQYRLPVSRNPIFAGSADYQRTYLIGGFFWNEALAEFLDTYGGKVYFYMEGKITPSKVDFNVLQTVTEGRNGPSKALYDFAAKKLGEEVCPAGSCQDNTVQLLITKSGRLIACFDTDFKGWGDSDTSWKKSIQILLDGVEPQVRFLR